MNRKCVYLPEYQIAWIKETAKASDRSDSYVVQVAIDCLMEIRR